jgi:hypothetical protein
MTNVTEVNFEPPYVNITRMLRERADAIEKGETSPRHVVLVEYYGGGEAEVFGYGNALSPGMAYMVLEHGKRRMLDIGV